MGCCGQKGSGCNYRTTRAVCKVCEIVDNDKTIKGVCYCKFCKANICEPCSTNWLRRAEASGLQTTYNFVEGIKGLLKKIKGDK